MDGLTDQELLEKIAADDVRAFEQLVRSYNRQIFQFARKLMDADEEAEDVTQEVFISIWEHRSEITRIHELKNYLFTLTRNKSINLLKEQASRYNREATYASRFSDRVNDEHKIHLNDYHRFVGELAGKLPDRRREIFKLKVEEGLSNQEIMKQLKISLQTVKNQLSKAYISIRESLADHL